MRVLKVYPSGRVIFTHMDIVQPCPVDVAVKLLEHGEWAVISTTDIRSLYALWRPSLTWRRCIWLLRRQWLRWSQRIEGLLYG